MNIDKHKEHNNKFKDTQQKLDRYYKELRKNATPAELLFKNALQESKIKFRFQKFFYKENFSCIVDFYLGGHKKIVVEIDGGYHNNPEQKRKDDYRTKFLIQERGCTVIRFTNEMVVDNVTACILKIKDLQKNRSPLPIV